MSKSLDFYFDFISPYSYLAHKQIRNIENKYKIKINYMPILLGGLFNLAEIKAAAFIPSKAKFMIKDCKLFAEKFDIKFKFNPCFPINTLNLMRGVLQAEKENKPIMVNFTSCLIVVIVVLILFPGIVKILS